MYYFVKIFLGILQVPEYCTHGKTIFKKNVANILYWGSKFKRWVKVWYNMPMRDMFLLVESIHKLRLNTLNSWIFFILMINKRKIFDFIAEYWIIACFNMHLNTFLEIQVHESRCHTFASSIWKYDESTIVIGFFVLSNG